MKKISDRTIEALRGVRADELVAHGIIETAPNYKGGKRGYICPMCHSGEGGNHPNGIGDGAGEFDNRNRFYCYACSNADNGGHKLSPIDLFGLARGLKKENFGEICRQMADEFGIAIDIDEMDDLPTRPRRSQSSGFTCKIEPPVDTAEKEMIQADLSASDEPLIDYLKFSGGKWRGLPLDILQRHECKFVAKWTRPTSRLEKKFCTPTPRMLIPASDDGYLARLTVKLEQYDDKTQKYIFIKEHVGTRRLFNADALNCADVVFCVEGYIDAMSIELAGFKAVALGGRGEFRLLADAVAEKKNKPMIIVLFDGDEPGRDYAPKAFDALIDVGCPAVIRFLTDDVSKLDANEILTTSGVDALQDRLQDIIDDSRAELDAVARELSREQNQLEKEKLAGDSASAIDDDPRNFLFNGDASDLDFARRLERVIGDRVRWLTDSERWLIYGGGVWTRASEKNSCVLPLVREVADFMNQHADNDDERKLADRLKSTRKMTSSITALKTLDSILITTEDLDRHPELLNVANGVVNLENGNLLAADPSLLITRNCRAAYDPQANSELVNKFFRDIMPDEETRAGLLRWLGYCLTGETLEEKILVWHGRGANGKGVLSATMLELLSSYGVGLTPRALLKTNRAADANAATASLNGLEGSRFAISEELPADGELDASLVKNLTGGDRINLRGLYGEYRTVTNRAKVNVSGNYLPKIENVADDGILRRLINMPFTVQFGKDRPADFSLKKKMLQDENLRGLLAILVREAVKWYRRDDGGLIISAQMKAETAEHLSQNNFVADFISDFYVRAANATVKAKDFIDELKVAYPYECRRFKRADLIKLIERAANVNYCEGKNHTRIFSGIGKLDNPPADADYDFGGEPINSKEVAMP